mgnify:CR=1 FL=1
MRMLKTASAGLSDIGRKRSTNQDYFLMDDAAGLYLLADGMGGHQAGEVAAKLVVDSMHRYLAAGSTAAEAPENGKSDPSLSAQANRLRGAVHYANQQVYQASATHSAYQGMGSTLAAVQFGDRTFVAANVGDSPIYLVHEGSIEMLSVTHTLWAEQAERVADESVFVPELQHVLTRGMGAEDRVAPDICEAPFFSGDRLILCSDGLSGKVGPDEMLAVTASRSAPAACRTLVDTANRRGGDDNISVIVIDVNKQDTFWMRLSRWISR